MLLAALIDAGLNVEHWLEETKKIALPADSFRVRIDKVRRCSLSAVEIDVVDMSHNHWSAHNHVHDHASEHDHRQEDFQRSLQDVSEIIANSNISAKAKELATRIFLRLARAEANVHGIPIEQIHFHEVGAIDAIIDIVGFAIAYDMLGIEQASCTALPLGGGTVKTAHGIFPVPAPAVLELLKEAEAPSSNSQIPFECLTPTGAAILCEITGQWSSAPDFLRVAASGYGAGSKNVADWPNVSRVILGIAVDSEADKPARFHSETISIIEANIDDQSPQALAFAVERILKSGALDVYITPIIMKKGRSGQLLTVLSKQEDEQRLQELLITETSTIGVRARRQSRLSAERRWESVKLGDSAVRIKLAYDLDGNLINKQPEFDDLAAYAIEKNISIKEASEIVLTRFNETLKTRL